MTVFRSYQVNNKLQIIGKIIVAVFILAFLNLSLLNNYFGENFGAENTTEQSDENEQELELFNLNQTQCSLIAIQPNIICNRNINNCLGIYSEVFTPPPELL